MKIKTIIIEDEPDSVQRLQFLLQRYHPAVQVEGVAGRTYECLNLVQNVRPELVFMDIQLADNDAFHLLGLIENIDFEIIFTTGHREFALPAIKVNPMDFLLKPIDRDDLAIAIAKLQERLELKAEIASKESRLKELTLQMNIPKITIPTSEGLEYVTVREICRCMSDGNYTLVFFRSGKKMLVSKTLGHFEDILNSYGFFRVHNSHLVNLQEVRAYHRGKGGYLILNDGSEIEVSSRRKEKLLQIMKQL